MDRFRMLPNYQYHDDDTGILETQYKKEMRDYQIYGNSIQNGTPAPDNPIEIQSVGEKTANLWGKDTVTAHKDNYGNLTYEWDDKGGLYFYNISTVGKTLLTDLTLPAGNYSVKSKSKSFFMRKNNSLVGGSSLFKTFTLTEEALITFYCFDAAGDTTYVQYMLVEGTYTEDTMPEFEPQGKYKIPIEVGGKNLFDISNVINTSAIINNGDGSITVSAYPASTTKRLYELCPSMKIGQTVRFSMITNGNAEVYLRNITKDFKTYIHPWQSFIVTEDILNSTVYFYRQTSAQGGGNATIYDIQFEEGTKATPYEPYQEPQTYNIFLDEPLRKCGDYADYIDFRNGKLVRQTRYYDCVYDAIYNKTGESRWGWNSIQTAYKRTWGYGYLAEPYKAAPMLNRFLGSYGGVSYARKEHFQLSSDNGYLYMALPYNYFEEFAGLEANTFPDLTLAERANIIDEYMITNKVDYLISLKTPIETAIDLPKIQLNKGTNIIKVKTATEPSQVNWQYYK